MEPTQPSSTSNMYYVKIENEKLELFHAAVTEEEEIIQE